MELRADGGVARDDRRDRAAILGARDDIGLVPGLEVIGVHEIGVTPFWAELESAQQRMLALQDEIAALAAAALGVPAAAATPRPPAG